MNSILALCVFLTLLCFPADLGGAWSGRLVSKGMSGSVEFELKPAGAGWKADAVFRSGPNEVRSALSDIKSDGAKLEFSATIEGAALHFEGQVAGDTIHGQFQVREGGKIVEQGEWSAARGTARAIEPNSMEAHIEMQETRSLVAAAAAVLRKRYVDAARGEAMARGLETQLAAGAYASIGDARVLADQLGRDLFAVGGDQHLKLSFSIETIALELPDAPETPAEREALRSALRTENFGFRKVEILDGNVGLLDLSRFARADLAGEAASMALGFLQNCDALVIDLRACAGGDPAMVSFLASWLFEGSPTHVADMFRREDGVTVQWWTAAWVPYRRLAAVPVCILTAARTFSAAEALAFHLQKLGRARVVGERTGGGAHPSRRVRLSERFAMTVPTSRAFDPETKLDWEGVGVKPDLEASATDALHAAHLDLLERLASAHRDPARARELREIAESVKHAR